MKNRFSAVLLAAALLLLGILLLLWTFAGDRVQMHEPPGGSQPQAVRIFCGEVRL